MTASFKCTLTINTYLLQCINIGYSVAMQLMQQLKLTAVQYNIPIIITNLAEPIRVGQTSTNLLIAVRSMLRDACAYCANQQIVLEVNTYGQFIATLTKNHIGVGYIVISYFG